MLEDRNLAWARWVRDQRKARHMTRRALAAHVEMDPSYVTLIERDGYVPRKHFISRIGMLFGNTTEAFLVTGHVPPESRAALHAFLRGHIVNSVPPDLAPMIRDLATSSSFKRKQAVAVVAALLKEPEPRKKNKKVEA